jgi:hypothetical protein
MSRTSDQGVRRWSIAYERERTIKTTGDNNDLKKDSEERDDLVPSAATSREARQAKVTDEPGDDYNNFLDHRGNAFSCIGRVSIF